MNELTQRTDDDSSRAMLIAPLPGPDRKRTEAMYSYRLVYRQPQADAEGCLMLWRVSGGREDYQVALERDDRFVLRWHCTCAEHIYRGEKIANHFCKHIRGLQSFTPALATNQLRRAA